MQLVIWTSSKEKTSQQVHKLVGVGVAAAVPQKGPKRLATKASSCPSTSVFKFPNMQQRKKNHVYSLVQKNSPT